MGAIVYAGRLFYESSRIHAAAVYCSDGRLGDHFDDFLQNGLHLPRYDRLALPGGPASLLDHGSCEPAADAVRKALAFLVDAHELERVLLVAHEGCAFYLQRLGLSGDRMEASQCQDLIRAAACIRELAPQLQIDAFFARISASRVVFERVGADPPPATVTATTGQECRGQCT